MTRRMVMQGGLLTVLSNPKEFGTERVQTIGLFPGADPIDVPENISRVATVGFTVPGRGGAYYVADSAMREADCRERRLSTFRAKDGRFFRLEISGPINLEVLGLRIGMAGRFAKANAAALREALILSKTIYFPAGEIDLRLPGGFLLPSCDGMTIAGQGWQTRIVGYGNIFSIPSLSDLKIENMWIVQTTNDGPAIQSYHENIRNLKLIKLKITIVDSAKCRNNSILIVLDKSAAKYGSAGLNGFIVEDCYLVSGRMGIEIQNHGDGERCYRYQNIHIKNSTFCGLPVDNGMGVSLSGWGDNCLVEGNKFIGCRGPNIEIVGADRTTIKDNYFLGESRNLGAPISISNFRVARQCRITGNKSNGKSAVGFFIEAVDGAYIANNTMKTYGSFIIKGKNIVVYKNCLVGMGSAQVVQIDHGQGVSIKENVIVSKDAKLDKRPLIAIFNGARDCVIDNNIMYNEYIDDSAKDLWVKTVNREDSARVYGNIMYGRGGKRLSHSVQ